MRLFRKSSLALAVAASLLQFSLIPSAFAQTSPQDKSSSSHDKMQKHPAVTAQPDVGPDVARYFNDPDKDPELSQEAIVKMLRQRIKYVFVIFNENHSFDNEYGTFPGVNGLYSDGLRPACRLEHAGLHADVHGRQRLDRYRRAFPDRARPERQRRRQRRPLSHRGSLPRSTSIPRQAWRKWTGSPRTSTALQPDGRAGQCIAEGTQFARLVMSHIDCDTIPFFWQWASRFTIFDNIFATEDTPSTPNAVAMIAGQSGETQWVKHGPNGQTYTVGAKTGTTQGPPLVKDPQPFYGSQFDTTTKDRQPSGANERYGNDNIASNLTFATLPLNFQGKNVTRIMDQNLNPVFDLPDIQKDIPYIRKLNIKPVNWRWYQEGYDLESTDTNAKPSHESYVSHHQWAAVLRLSGQHAASAPELPRDSPTFSPTWRTTAFSKVVCSISGAATRTR